MRRGRFALGAGLAVTVFVAAGARPSSERAPRADGAVALYRARLDTLADALRALHGVAVSVGPSDTGTVRAAFRRVRVAYKRVECLIEYLDPADASVLNGPGAEGADEMAGDGGDPGEADEILPLGLLQSAERMLYQYPVLFVATRQRLMTAIVGARMAVRRSRAAADTARLGARDVVAAARVELVRVATLGLAGDDSRSAHAGLAEAAVALGGTRDVVALYGAMLEARDAGSWRAVDRAFAAAVARLEDGRQGGGASDGLRFNAFDRLRFIVVDANPLGVALLRAATALGTSLRSADARRGGALRPSAPTVFATDAFDPFALAPPLNRAPPASEIALGAALFRDPALSGGGARSCASCHQPEHGFRDGLARAAPLPGQSDAVLRHTPTLLNVAFADLLFDDGRASSLEAQVGVVVETRAEMAGTLAVAAQRLQARPAVAAQFALAFPTRGMSAGQPVTPAHIADAIAAYERTLVSFDTRVDRALRGDTLALAENERRGFTLFMGKAACGTCHFLPLLNGMRPPDYAQTDLEVVGVPSRADTIGATIDADSGRARVTHDPVDVGAMKTPGLRFIEPHGPYMHNGVYGTLAEVVDFYDRGGGRGIGARVGNQTLAPTPLHLAEQEKADLIAFLEALRDSLPSR